MVQLRQENLRADSYNLVGFQNHMRFGEQARVLRMIPGLERAEFLRYGQVHRNTYINGPALLNACLQLKSAPAVFFAGQISGVEGYVESIATGLAAGRYAASLVRGEPVQQFPRETPSVHCVTIFRAQILTITSPRTSPSICCLPWTRARAGRLRHDKKARHAEICKRALAGLEAFLHARV